MLSRATKAIKWSFAGGPMTARFCSIWILSPLIILNDISHNFDFCVVQTAERVYVIVLWRDIKLWVSWFETGQISDNDYTAITEPKNKIKGPGFSWMC